MLRRPRRPNVSQRSGIDDESAKGVDQSHVPRRDAADRLDVDRPVELVASRNLFQRENRKCVDGGVLNPVPVSGAVTLGADVVISSNLSGTIGERMAKVGSGGPPRRRYIVENITRTLEIMQSKIVEESATRADVAIQPSFGTPPGLLDFKRGRELEHVGEEAVERQLSELRSVLPWLA